MHGAARGIEPDHEHRTPKRDPEALALPDREAVDAAVGAHGPAFGIDDWSRPDAPSGALRHEGVIAPRRDEAELLALALGRPGEAAGQCLGAHLRLGGVAERQKEARELVGAEHVQEIALVFLVI